MQTLINPSIIIIEPVKNKNLGYYTTLESTNTNYLMIKAKSASGRKRGTVGRIRRDGIIEVKDEVMKYITPLIKKKIKMALELIYNSKEHIPVVNKNGLVNYRRA